jgi:hypothetical protein
MTVLCLNDSLFEKGADNGKGNSKSGALWLFDGLHPTLRDETAKDGAPRAVSARGERRVAAGAAAKSSGGGCDGGFDAFLFCSGDP